MKSSLKSQLQSFYAKRNGLVSNTTETHCAITADAATPLQIPTHEDLRTTARVRVLRDFIGGAIAHRRALVEGRGPRSVPSRS